MLIGMLRIGLIVEVVNPDAQLFLDEFAQEAHNIQEKD